MNFTVAISLARVESSSCSAGSLRTEVKIGRSLGVNSMMVEFPCWSGEAGLAEIVREGMRILTEARNALKDGCVLFVVFGQR